EMAMGAVLGHKRADDLGATMRLYPCLAGAALALLLAACQREAGAPAEAGPSPSNPTAVWFLCDGIDAPSIFVASEPDANAAFTLREFDKTRGALTSERRLVRGGEEGAAGSVITTLLENGAEAGSVRTVNPDVLTEPSAAFTPPVSSLRLGDRMI